VRNQFLRAVLLVVLLSATFSVTAFAEVNFDFGLPLFGFEEIRFEKSKPADFNIHLLKKYILENEGSILQQLHGIVEGRGAQRRVVAEQRLDVRAGAEVQRRGGHSHVHHDHHRTDHGDHDRRADPGAESHDPAGTGWRDHGAGG